MTSQLIPTALNPLQSQSDSKDLRSRLTQFSTWMEDNRLHWTQPDLALYGDHLLAKGLKPSSITAHLSTIRAHYQHLLKSNAIREQLYAQTPADAAPADCKAAVDEVLTRIANAIDPDHAPVTVIQQRDIADSAHLRLTVEQANALLAAPGLTPLICLRDTAMIALMLCTGIREGELVALHVADLRQMFGGVLALHVREGKGAVARLIPYGEMAWCLAYVEKWVALAGITSGTVFRHVNKGGNVQGDGLTTRAVQKLFKRYPISIDGVIREVQPHDLRRTYARRLYEAGTPLLAIQQNLGHADSKTTEGYIGRLDAGQRKPPMLFTPPHMQQLNKLKTNL